MWKEEFRIGNEIIDEQHRSLFAKTNELINLFRKSGVTNKQECIDMVLFLKNYAARHFAEEEAYQKSLEAPNYEEHKQEHQEFLKTVLIHEQKMIETDFSHTEVQNFIATLLTWLLHHVAGSDQQIGQIATVKDVSHKNHVDLVRLSISEVLNHVAGIEKNTIIVTSTQEDKLNDDDIIIRVEFVGEIAGGITFMFPRVFAQNLVYAMIRFVPKVIDEFEKSVLFEVLNLIGGVICNRFSKDEGKICEIEQITITNRDKNSKAETLTLDTGIGIIEADISLDV